MAVKKINITKEIKHYSITDSGELKFKEYPEQVGLIVDCIRNPEASCMVMCPWFGLARLEDKGKISYQAELKCLAKTTIFPCDAHVYMDYLNGVNMPQMNVLDGEGFNEADNLVESPDLRNGPFLNKDNSEQCYCQVKGQFLCQIKGWKTEKEAEKEIENHEVMHSNKDLYMPGMKVDSPLVIDPRNSNFMKWYVAWFRCEISHRIDIAFMIPHEFSGSKFTYETGFSEKLLLTFDKKEYQTGDIINVEFKSQLFYSSGGGKWVTTNITQQRFFDRMAKFANDQLASDF